MKFDVAFVATKQGCKIKRPTWAGYWTWNEKQETIRMHCRPEESDTEGPVLALTAEGN